MVTKKKAVKKKESDYQLKRDFESTNEPAPEKDSASQPETLFVIQKHHARKLHYDFRLRIGDVLKSWAVPKDPPRKPGDKNLAVETEDHPLDYANFKGNIPEGNYGAGKVEIWDKGTYENLRLISMNESYKNGLIEVWLSGKTLKGAYALVKTKFKTDKKRFGDNTWLWLKMKEDKFK